MMSAIQIGKNGLTEGVIERLKNDFKTHEIVRVHIVNKEFKERDKVKAMAAELLEKLGKKYTCKIIGFTLVVRKWRKEMR
jgi:RNA-binding protein YhbY